MRNSWLCKHRDPRGRRRDAASAYGGEGGGGKGLEVRGMRRGTARSVFVLRAVCEGCL